MLALALASVERPPVIMEQHAVAEQRSTTERHVSEQPSKNTSRYDTPVPITPREQPAATKDNSQYFGPTPVTLVHVRKSREQSATADIEAACPTVTAAHASIAVRSDCGPLRAFTHRIPVAGWGSTSRATFIGGSRGGPDC